MGSDDVSATNVSAACDGATENDVLVSVDFSAADVVTDATDV